MESVSSNSVTYFSDEFNAVIQNLNLQNSHAEPAAMAVWQGSHDEATRNHSTEQTETSNKEGENLPLKDVHIYVEIFSNGKAISEACYGYLEALGATVEKKLNKKCNVVLWKEGSFKTIEKAKKYGAKIVNSLWLEDCVENFHCADFAKYTPNLPSDDDLPFIGIKKNKKRKTMEPKRLCWSPKAEKELKEFQSSPIKRKRCKKARESARDYGLEARIEIRLGCQRKLSETFEGMIKGTEKMDLHKGIEGNLEMNQLIEENKDIFPYPSFKQTNSFRIDIRKVTGKVEGNPTKNNKEETKGMMRKENLPPRRETLRRACSVGNIGTKGSKKDNKVVPIVEQKQRSKNKKEVKRSKSSILPDKSKSEAINGSQRIKLKILIPLRTIREKVEVSSLKKISKQNSISSEESNSLKLKISIPIKKENIITRGKAETKEVQVEEGKKKVVTKAQKKSMGGAENKKSQKGVVVEDKEQKVLRLIGFDNKEENTTVQNFCKKFGFTVFEEKDETVEGGTVVVYADRELTPGYSVAIAMLNGIPIVNKNWIIESLKKGKLEEKSTYSLAYDKKIKTETFAKKNIFIAKELLDFPECGLKRKDVVKLLEMAGGKISESVQKSDFQIVKKVNDFNNRIKAFTIQNLNQGYDHDNLKRAIREPHTLENGAVYVGEWVDNAIDGNGIMTFPDGSRYEGMFKNDQPNGKGRFTSGDGDVYEGDWVNGKCEGEGTFYSISGGVYNGQWIDDFQQGYGNKSTQFLCNWVLGTEKWPEGSNYTGQYFRGMKHGKGFFKWSDGSTYEGEFKNNKMEGYGVYRWGDGREYRGYWKDNGMDGTGEFIWPDGHMYKGEYLRDKKHGKGHFVWPDGRKFLGEWRNGKRNGVGTMNFPDGTKEVAEWRDDYKLRIINERR